MDEAYARFWADQFGALVRDKVCLMIEALKVTGFNSLAHHFQDDDGDGWRLVFDDGEFYLMSMDDDERVARLDLAALGVTR